MRKYSIVTMSNGWGGAEVHTTNLAMELLANNHYVEIIEIGHNEYQRADYEGKEQILVHHIPVSKKPLHPGILDSLKVLLYCRGNTVIVPKGSIDTGSLIFDILVKCLCKCYITIEHLACRAMPDRKTERH